jgi:hypothetical protein
MKKKVIENYVRSKLGRACLEVQLIDDALVIIVVKIGTDPTLCGTVNSALKSYFHVEPMVTSHKNFIEMFLKEWREGRIV